MIAQRKSMVTALTVGILLSVGWLLYRPGTGGVFLLDDFDTLGGLAVIEDLGSAIDYIGSFNEGPLGRPLAMASFALQAESWDEDPASFIRANTAIHLFNGLLVFLFLSHLCRALRFDDTDSRFVAIAATALWIVMPLLASANLLIVQRMTTLSATFVLTGLAGYLSLRRRIKHSTDMSLLLLGLVLALTTLLAVLSKENGALLPTLVLVLELTLLSRPESVPTVKWRSWMAVFLVLPTVVIAVYLAFRIPYSESVLARRDFDTGERLLTQARVLWEYLSHALLPRPTELGPFHDAYPVARSLTDPATAAAACSWVLLAVGAFVWRRRYPVAAFAVLWYLAAHSIESTTIPLELYFEHRNYVPIIGPLFALCAVAARVPTGYQYSARTGILAYIFVNAGILFSVTSLWGQPMVAAGNWYANAPNSMRAVSNLANRQMLEMGPMVGAITLGDFAQAHPKHSYLHIPQLAVACNARPDLDYTEDVERLLEVLPKTGFSYTAGEMLDTLQSVITDEPCKGVDSEVIANLAAALMRNPRYRVNRVYRQYHEQLLARLAWDDGDVEKAIEHLHNAFEIWPHARVNTMMITALVSIGKFEEAREFAAEAERRLPRHPLRRRISRRELDGLSDYIDSAERDARTSDESSGAGLAHNND